jgi:hypothetical protein
MATIHVLCTQPATLLEAQLDTPYVVGYHLLIQDPQVQVLLVDLSHTVEGFDKLCGDSDNSIGCECRALGALHQTPS